MSEFIDWSVSMQSYIYSLFLMFERSASLLLVADYLQQYVKKAFTLDGFFGIFLINIYILKLVLRIPFSAVLIFKQMKYCLQKNISFLISIFFISTNWIFCITDNGWGPPKIKCDIETISLQDLIKVLRYDHKVVYLADRQPKIVVGFYP